MKGTQRTACRTKNFGRKSLNEIKEILNNLGLGFGMKLGAQGRIVGPPQSSPLPPELGSEAGE